MSKQSDDATGRGVSSVEDVHRKGPEIDLGRRRFAWLTVGTASTMTLMSKSALGATVECGSKSHSAITSAMGNDPNYMCLGLSHSYWRNHRDNWPSGIRPSHQFSSICPMAPAFNGKLIKVLRRRGNPQIPPAWEPFLSQMPNNVVDNYVKQLKNCGRAMVASVLNAEQFDPHYPYSMGMVQMAFRDAWSVPIAPGTPEECLGQIEYCADQLRTLKNQFERHYG